METLQLVDGAAAPQTNIKPNTSAKQTPDLYNIIKTIAIVFGICMLLYTFIAVTYLLALQPNSPQNEDILDNNINSTESPSSTHTNSQKFSDIIADQTAEDTDDRFEASDIVYDSKREVYWIVFDNLWSLSKISDLTQRNEQNILIGSNEYTKNNDKWGTSQFEAITWDSKTDIFYIMSEANAFTNNVSDIVHHPVLHKVTYDGDKTYIVQTVCAVDFQAPTDNKGFEGLGLIEIDGKNYFVGLCEGNYCDSGDDGRDKGNGRVVLFQFEPRTLSKNGSVATDGKYQYLVDDGIYCLYETIKQFELPAYIDFTDYSSVVFRVIETNKYDMAITSQIDSVVWIGKVEWSLNGPNFDMNENDGTKMEFPKNSDDEIQFCNVEGISFTNVEGQIVIVSDRANKDKDYYTPACEETDQTISSLEYQP